MSKLFLPLVLIIIGTALPDAARFYKDGPPTGHTGGFDEPTCLACHFDGPLNDPAAWAALLDVPEEFEGDSLYSLKVGVSRPTLGAGGFELSSRFTDGSQAGSFATVDERTSVEIDGQAVQFVMHTLDGTDPTHPDSIFWTLLWTAPPRADTVVFHLAANAANGDDSELGDLIRTGHFQSIPGHR